MRTKAWIKLRIRRIEKLRDYIQKHEYEFFDEDIEELYKFLEETSIAVVEDKATLQELIEVAMPYNKLQHTILNKYSSIVISSITSITSFLSKIIK